MKNKAIWKVLNLTVIKWYIITLSMAFFQYCIHQAVPSTCCMLTLSKNACSSFQVSLVCKKQGYSVRFLILDK